MEDADTFQHSPVLQQKTKSVMPEFYKGKGKNKPIKTSSDSEEFSSPAILSSYSQFKSEKSKMMTEETNTPIRWI